MAKPRDDLRSQLQQQALELFRERGYDGVTTAEIAAQAGVTERTFFRYFPDKREVLFEEDPRLRPTLSAAVADAPAGWAPLAIVLHAFEAIEPLLEANRMFIEPRRQIIASAPALKERAEAKSAALAFLLAEALQQRGVDPRLALLAARTGLAVFSYAAQAWYTDRPARGLKLYLAEAAEALRGLAPSP